MQKEAGDARELRRGVRQRPVFLDLRRIRMPVGAWTSIGHRLSGVVLAVTVPFAIGLLALSLREESGFESVQALFMRPAVRVAAVLAAWSLAHHVLAGIRHLASDFDIGSPLCVARRSAWFVNLAGVAIALLAAGALL